MWLAYLTKVTINPIHIICMVETGCGRKVWPTLIRIIKPTSKSFVYCFIDVR